MVLMEFLDRGLLLSRSMNRVATTMMTSKARTLPSWALLFVVVCASSCEGAHDNRPACAGSPIPACPGAWTSTLPGVHTELNPARCTFTAQEATAGLDVPFTVVAETAVADVQPSAYIFPSCSQPDSSGFQTFVAVTGNGQSYCPECDDHSCADPFRSSLSLDVGCVQGSVHWEGLNWSGPGSAGAVNAKGAAFPPGNYLLEIHQVGQAGAEQKFFEMTASMTLTLTP